MSENYDLRPNTFVDRKDGLTKSFTTIDHSKKPKVFYEDQSPSDYKPEEYKKKYIYLITRYPAVLCPKDMVHLIKRGQGMSKIEWNEDMLENLHWNMLLNIYTIVKNSYQYHKDYDPTINIEE